MPELLAPNDAGEAAALLQAAREEGRSVLPCGRRTRVARHDPGAAPDAWLSLAALDELHWLDAADQTCEVGAGCSPAALDAAATEHGLALGACAPHAQDGSLGGLFLAPDVSLLHGSAGAPRDQVLGARWLLADGRVVRTGARVVKSVAGYDLTRLFLGSRGRLAACLSLTLRLRPRPRDPRWFRTAEPARLRAAAAAAPRLFVQARPEEPAWLQCDGWHPDPVLAEPGDPGDAEEALRRCLDAFATAPRRVAHERVPAEGARDAFDWLGLQEADRAQPARPLPAGAGAVPFAHDSPWQDALARACAPAAPRFGERPA